MIHVNMRGFSKVLSAFVVLTMMAGSAHAAKDRQDSEPTYPPDWTWLAFATTGSVKRPFMDTYSSAQNEHASRGTLLWTFYTLDFVALPIPSMPTPTEGWRVTVRGQ